MAKANIWMPLYVADYLADTNRLSTIEHGAYLLLIIDYWRNGAPPDNDEILRRITKLERDEFTEMKALLCSFFTIEKGQWIHKRIESERLASDKKMKTAIQKGKAGALARKNNRSKLPEVLPEVLLEVLPEVIAGNSFKFSNHNHSHSHINNNKKPLPLHEKKIAGGSDD